LAEVDKRLLAHLDGLLSEDSGWQFLATKLMEDLEN
jgi:hypothetical protein